MKKVFITFSFVLCAVLFGPYHVMSGKPFEGVINFKISYPDSKMSESQMAMFPKMLTVTIKGSNSKTEIKTQMGDDPSRWRREMEQDGILDVPGSDRRRVRTRSGVAHAGDAHGGGV